MGKLAANALRAGELVPDSVTQAMLAERLRHPDTNDGFVLDGFPRTTTDQATWLDAMLTGCSDVAAVIVLAAPDEVLLDRAQRRGRMDDTATAIARRLAIYRERTKPLLGYYGDLVTGIDGARDTGLVHENIVKPFKQESPTPKPTSGYG